MKAAPNVIPPSLSIFMRVILIAAPAFVSRRVTKKKKKQTKKKHGAHPRSELTSFTCLSITSAHRVAEKINSTEEVQQQRGFTGAVMCFYCCFQGFNHLKSFLSPRPRGHCHTLSDFVFPLQWVDCWFEGFFFFSNWLLFPSFFLHQIDVPVLPPLCRSLQPG